jgi:hypothetical protein
MALLSAWLLGLVLGARHAFEPDHLAAIGAMVSTGRRSALVGAMWGAGHAFTLLCVGGSLTLFRAQIPGPLANAFEVGVAILLLFLGARSLWWAATHRHHHSDDHHHDHVHAHHGIPRRPFFVGVMHGLAGSGALTALALASMPSVSSALVYLILFALGTVAAMALASGLLGYPLERLAGRARLALASLAGVLSVATGLFWGWRSLHA